MKRDQWIKKELKRIVEDNQLRTLRVFPESGGKVSLNGTPYLNFSSNDYLNLSHHPALVDTGIRAATDYGAGATASRLVVGTLPLHQKLENMLAHHKGYPDAILFGSGFLTNCGIIPVLAGRNDLIFADRLVHASIIDAIRLSGARLYRFRHNDPDHLEQLLNKHCHSQSRSLIITESVFSMDGDIAPLTPIAQLADTYESMLMIDEAHATGIFGQHGSGLVGQYGIQSQVTIAMGTMSKALGGYGGFAACSSEMKQLLLNRSRSFIYTTALPPFCLASAQAAITLLESQEQPGAELLRRAEIFRSTLHHAGLDTLHSESQIVPVVVGENKQAVSLSQQLFDQGIIAIAMRPPTVPEGTARLRFSLTLAHTEEDLERTCDILIACFKKEGLI